MELWPHISPHDSSLNEGSACEASLYECVDDEDSLSDDPDDDSNLKKTPAMVLTDWIRERREAMKLGDKAWDDSLFPYIRNGFGMLARNLSDKDRYRSIEALLLL
jgi:hypothetical protein